MHKMVCEPICPICPSSKENFQFFLNMDLAATDLVVVLAVVVVCAG